MTSTSQPSALPPAITPEEEQAYRVIEALCHIPGRRAENPTVFFVVGQQGAGKSVAIKHLIRSLPRDEAVTILDQDAAAARAPGFRETAKVHGFAEAEEKAKPFMRRTISQLANHALSTRSHVIIEVADPNIPLEPIIKSFSVNARYKSELVVLAVPDVVSRQNLAIRYEDEMRTRGYGRKVARADHDQAYRKWPARVAGLLMQDVFDKVQVVEPRRGVDVSKAPAVYSVRERLVENGAITSQTMGLKPLQAMLTLRSNGMTELQRRAFDKRWRDIISEAPARASTYEQDRESAANLLRQPSQALFSRELHMAIDGVGGIRSDLQVEGVREKIERLAHGVKRVDKPPLAIDPFPLLASLKLTVQKSKGRREAAPQLPGDKVIAARKKPRRVGPTRDGGLAF